MPIYADHTELRAQSRLPDAVAKQCIELPGLERVTGGDFLITTEKAPPDVRMLKGFDTAILNEDSPTAIAEVCGLPLPTVLTALQFREACSSGLLVQRKTGRDLASSVPKLSEILTKMLRWSDRPWLLFVGTLGCSKHGKAVVDGEELNWDYNSMQGALEAWQLRGGFVTFLSRDSLVAPWVSRWMDKLRGMEPEKILPPRTIAQPIVGPESGVKPWRSTLMSFPNCGQELASRIAEGNNTLAACLEWMTCPGWLEASGGRPRGVGIKTVRSWRQWLGLDEDYLKLLVAAVPLGH